MHRSGRVSVATGGLVALAVVSVAGLASAQTQPVTQPVTQPTGPAASSEPVPATTPAGSSQPAPATAPAAPAPTPIDGPVPAVGAPAAVPLPGLAPAGPGLSSSTPRLSVPQIPTGPVIAAPASPAPAAGSAGQALPPPPVIALPDPTIRSLRTGGAAPGATGGGITLTPPPPPPLTPLQEARQLAPAFAMPRDYQRLVQCYGTANFMEAVTRVRANRPGATADVRNLVTELIRLQGAMQPMVLIASDTRTERRFRADYTAVGDRLQRELGASRNPEATLQTNLRTVQACQRDVVRWRGGR